MNEYLEMIQQLKQVDYPEKRQFLEFFLNLVQKNKRALPPDAGQELLNYCYELVDLLPDKILNAKNYREKDILFMCEDFLLGLIMVFCPTPGDVPEPNLRKMQSLVELVRQQRSIETALDSIFEQQAIAATDINRVLYWVRLASDEYQRGRLFVGLAYYAKDMGKLSEDAAVILGKFLEEEFSRLLSVPELNRDCLENLELLADICKYFPSETFRNLLLQTLELPHNSIRFYAVESLLQQNQPIEQKDIDSLAQDLVYGNLTYNLLVSHGIAHLFPKHLAEETYLGKSDLVHWLTYPTELGMPPEEIEYLGRVTFLFRKDPYHVFKFRSGSTTLSDNCRNQWLIGWSCRNGATFSNFDKLQDYELDTLEKTLKNIKKKLLK